MPVPCKSKCALCLSHYGAGAVADGNAEANGFAGAAGTMEAIYIGNDTNWWRTRPGPNHKQHQQQQQGPFIMADLEDGMFSGECVSAVTLLRPQMHNNAATIMLLTVSLSVVESPESEPDLLCSIIHHSTNDGHVHVNVDVNVSTAAAGDDYIDPNAVPSWHGLPYVTAMLKGRSCQFSLKGGSATGGSSSRALATLYDGVRPQHYNYEPMCVHTPASFSSLVPPRLSPSSRRQARDSETRTGGCCCAGKSRALSFLAQAVTTPLEHAGLSSKGR